VTTDTKRARIPAWFDQWGNIVPLLAAEFIVWLGFGGLIPVLPLYFVEQGLDLATLGLVIAAWPIARLVTEPIFGWLADRTARVPWMVGGLLLTGVFELLPLFLVGPLAFVILRGAAGIAAAMYDPAARGYLTDATPPERRGEAFGLYGAAQMGGLLIGPAIGAFGAGMFGGIQFVFVFSAIASFLAAGAVAWRVKETGGRTHPAPAHDATEFPRDTPSVTGRAASDVDADRTPNVDPSAPRRLLNRGLIAALVINVGGYYAGGTYEVIWSLFLEDLGAGLDLIGFTFAMFGLPVLLLSPFAGRIVDRRGSYLFIVVGCVVPTIVGILYTLIVDPLWAVPLIIAEATAFALLNPALYAVVAANSPVGKSSTAQGIFGAAGTMGFIVASLLTGVLAEEEIIYPFYVFSGVMLICLVLGLLIGGRRLRYHPPAAIAPPTAEAAEVVAT
jgi:MFS family permease